MKLFSYKNDKKQAVKRWFFPKYLRFADPLELSTWSAQKVRPGNLSPVFFSEQVKVACRLCFLQVPKLEKKNSIRSTKIGTIRVFNHKQLQKKNVAKLISITKTQRLTSKSSLTSLMAAINLEVPSANESKHLVGSITKFFPLKKGFMIPSNSKLHSVGVLDFRVMSPMIFLSFVVFIDSLPLGRHPLIFPLRWLGFSRLLRFGAAAACFGHLISFHLPKKPGEKKTKNSPPKHNKRLKDATLYKPPRKTIMLKSKNRRFGWWFSFSRWGSSRSFSSEQFFWITATKPTKLLDLLHGSRNFENPWSFIFDVLMWADVFLLWSGPGAQL